MIICRVRYISVWYFFFAISIVCHLQQCTEAKAYYVAYSLREAVFQTRNGIVSDNLVKLGSIARVAGMVYDRVGRDAILVGIADSTLPNATLDDLVVALRARLLHNSWPLVSIDPMLEPDESKNQVVRFDGQIANTAFGKSFLDCDILLKLYSLQMVETIATISSYNLLIEDDIREAAKAADVRITRIKWYHGDKGTEVREKQRGIPISSKELSQARFWFYVSEPYVYFDKKDVFGIKELRLAVQSEDAPANEDKNIHTAQKRFSEQWSNHFEDMTRMYPVLKRLKILYDLTAVAEAIKGLDFKPDLHFFLEDYTVKRVENDPTYKLKEIYGICERSDGLRHLVRVSGGLEFKSEIRWLNDGDFTHLREIVLKSRPSRDTLTWRLPLDGWQMQNARDLDLPSLHEVAADKKKKGTGPGCSVTFQSFVLDPKAPEGGLIFSKFEHPKSQLLPLKGVLMKMTISNDSYKAVDDGELDKLREKGKTSKPKVNSLFWKEKE